MPGTITISTLSDGTNSTSATNPILGSARAWVSFYGLSPLSIYSSYNVSSVTRNGTGDYTINFANSLGDGNYNSVFGGRNDGPGSGANFSVVIKTGTSPTATALTIVAGPPTTGALADSGFISASIFR